VQFLAQSTFAINTDDKLKLAISVVRRQLKAVLYFSFFWHRIFIRF